MRKTKIVCTLGPKTATLDMIRQFVAAGMNVVRVNMAHGDFAEQEEKINNIKQVREETNTPIAIMIDVKGPDIRTKTFAEGKITLKDGDAFTFTTRDIVGDQSIVAVNYDGLHNDLQPGNEILAVDGKVRFLVQEVVGQDIHTIVTRGGVIGNTKNMHFPNAEIYLPYIRPKDVGDIGFAVKMGAEYIAASFVSSAKDIALIKEELKKAGNENIGIIAKIENEKGVKNVREILEACDGLMVARGDLGVEIPFERLPHIQKTLIKTANEMGKISITATEMLESMINNERPTRAEVSDVGNAVYDGTGAVMLSGESAYGDYPLQAVTIMGKICSQVESEIHYKHRYNKTRREVNGINDTVANSAVQCAYDIDAKGIIACTQTGGTAQLISKYKPASIIYAITPDTVTYQKLALIWGVRAYMIDEYHTLEELYTNSVTALKNADRLSIGDNVVFAMGYPFDMQQITNTIRVDVVR